jgi:NAD(P)-dependent dehydrogenase (short-subunit alcohol dehydrogenase family)
LFFAFSSSRATAAPEGANSGSSGYVKTWKSLPFEDIDKRGERMIEAAPAGRGGTPAEIADAVVYFLKSSNFVTEQILAVDGGLSLK